MMNFLRQMISSCKGVLFFQPKFVIYLVMLQSSIWMYNYFFHDRALWFFFLVCMNDHQIQEEKELWPFLS